MPCIKNLQTAAKTIPKDQQARSAFRLKCQHSFSLPSMLGDFL